MVRIDTRHGSVILRVHWVGYVRTNRQYICIGTTNAIRNVSLVTSSEFPYILGGKHLGALDGIPYTDRTVNWHGRNSPTGTMGALVKAMVDEFGDDNGFRLVLQTVDRGPHVENSI